MKLWLLVRREGSGRYHGGADWDEFIGFVIRAPDEARAREMATSASGTSRLEPYWQDVTQSSCTEITVDGSEEVILDSFRAG